MDLCRKCRDRTDGYICFSCAGKQVAADAERFRMLEQASRDNDPDNDTEFARIAELEQQLAAAQAELAALREPIEGLRLTPEEVGRIIRALRNEGIAVSEIEPVLEDLRDAHRIIAQQREQLASRDAWVRTADRLPTEADAAVLVYDGTRTMVAFIGAVCKRRRDRWRSAYLYDYGDPLQPFSFVPTHWRALPAPPADNEGGDDA